MNTISTEEKELMKLNSKIELWCKKNKLNESNLDSLTINILREMGVFSERISEVDMEKIGYSIGVLYTSLYVYRTLSNGILNGSDLFDNYLERKDDGDIDIRSESNKIGDLFFGGRIEEPLNILCKKFNLNFNDCVEKAVNTLTSPTKNVFMN